MRHRRLIATGAAGLLCGLAALAALAFGAPKKQPAPPQGNGNDQVTVTLSKASNVLNFSNAVVGDQKTGSVVVSNGGKLAGDFALDGEFPSASGATALASRLQLVVTKTPAGSAAAQLYSGSLSGFNSAAPLSLGTIYPQQGSRSPKSVTLNFHISFPTTGTNAGDNALQNLGPYDQRFRIDATQQTGNTDKKNKNAEATGTGQTTVKGASDAGGNSTGTGGGISTDGDAAAPAPAQVDSAGSGGSFPELNLPDSAPAGSSSEGMPKALQGDPQAGPRPETKAVPTPEAAQGDSGGGSAGNTNLWLGGLGLLGVVLIMGWGLWTPRQAL